MSSIAYIDITYHSLQEVLVPEILEMYLTNGWSLNDQGHISLRSLGDKDDFNWIQLRQDQTYELMDILQKKIIADEDPAVVLMLSGMEIGSAITFYPKHKRISFLLDVGRKIHPELPRWTDVSWYLPLVIKPLLAGGLAISQLEFTEIP